MSKELLKPCPFCGGNGKLKRKQMPDVGLELTYIECEKCGCISSIFKVRLGRISPRAKLEDYAFKPLVDMWNTRFEPDKE